VGFLAQPVDILPTVLDLAGVASPQGLDGISLQPLLGGEPMPNRRSIAVTSPALPDSASESVCSAITDGVWMLQYRGPKWPAELHHLEADPTQSANRFDDCRAEAARLHEEYVALLQRVGTDPQKVALRSGLPEGQR
jgi:arylsulfatase A-like enzyme